MQRLSAPEIGLNKTKQRPQKSRPDLKVKDIKGNISAHGFLLGEVQKERNETTGNWKEMYREHNVYHVRACTDAIEKGNTQWSVWESWDIQGHNLKIARKFFKELSI